MQIQQHSSHHGLITLLLAVMVLVSTGVSLLRLGGFLNNLLVLGIAFAMTVLVTGKYMGLKKEGHLVHWTLVFPLALFALLVALLLGDIAKMMSRF
jgi:caa(3)-type oxidase subunit IV